jgi:5-methylthioadenosine/S-adenosylhomocysteine deaminase
MEEKTLRISKVTLFITCFLICGITGAAAVTIYDIQYTTDPSGDSPYAGQSVTIEGFVSAIFYDGYIVAEDEGAWHAIYVYSKRDGPQVGDEVTLTGTVSEYNNLTEISDVTAYDTISTGNEISPVVIDAQAANQEMYESVLISIPDVTVTSLNTTYNEWTISDDAGSIPCNDKADYLYFPQMGDYLNSVTGIQMYEFGAYRLEPRETLDIDIDTHMHYALKGDIITMNETRDIIPDGYVEVYADKIMSIGTTQPSGIDIIEVNGLIFPGLIDSHNHPRFNVLSEIPFPHTYTERYEWQDDPMYGDFWDQYGSILDYPDDDGMSDNLWKLAESRALCAGTTMIQGYNCNGSSAIGIAHSGMGINNAERFPSRIYSSTFPLRYESDWRNTKTYEYWDRFVIHLSEGFSAAALQEFYTWQSWDLMDWRTTIIHGVPLTEAEWDIMASANAHLIWSPFSNIVLYDETADVPGAIDAGVNVALAPDWTESGEDNMLAEMKYADYINQTRFGDVITPQQFAEFVTCNAAYAIGQQDRVGSIVEGYQADLMAIPGTVSEPYDDLLAAEPADVKLTVVNGRPMYGDPALMNLFTEVDPQENISICGEPKNIAIQVDAHGIFVSDKSLSEVMSELLTAYDQAFPKLCDFISYDPCGGTGETPTPTPTGPTPTPTPPGATPTGTQQPCDELGVTIWMPSNDFGPGDPCSLEARVCNPSSVIYLDIPLFVIMDIYGSYYFAPSFSDYDNYIINELESGMYTELVIPEFSWPSGVGNATGILVYGAMTDKQISQLFGTYSIFSFGWHS